MQDLAASTVPARKMHPSLRKRLPRLSPKRKRLPPQSNIIQIS
jgi:hypothetical protein